MDEGSPEIVPVNSPASDPDPEPESSESGDGDGDGAPEPLSRKLPIPSAELNLYRAAVMIRAVLVAAFFRYRVTHPVSDAPGLWQAAVACELWLAFAWLVAQLPKLSPTNRATHLDRLASRYEKDGEPSRLAGVDVLVTAADAGREPPLATANTVLSVLAADYPAGKLACYVSDDGADMLVFEALFEAARFARRWVPFCRRHGVERRAPELYFARGVDYLRDRAAPSFVKERRAMKREYEEFKVRMNYLAAKARKVPEDGWAMSDGTPWPGNNPRDHPAMIQVLLGHPGDQDAEGHELPRLFYVSREKRPGFQHHKKAGALNALLRVSALLTNGAYVLNLCYDHCVTNSCALRESMCFLMDPEAGNRTCFVQFPLRVDDDSDDRQASRHSVFFDIDMKCLDGIQGPVYVGSGCCFNRKALYGFDPALAEDDEDETTTRWSSWCFRKVKERALRRTMSTVPLLDSEESDEQTGADNARTRRRLRSYRAALERHFGHSPAFIASAFAGQGRCGGGGSDPTDVAAGSLLREAIHVVSCSYEERTRWGKDVGWIYGSGGGDLVTGFRMHARGWESAYCAPARAALRSFSRASPTDLLAGASRRAVAAMGVLLSRHCPVWGGGRLRILLRLGYVSCVAYPLASLPLTVYCALPAACLLTGKFVFPDDVSYYDGVLLILLLSSVVATVVLELRWSGVPLRAWWRDQKLWVVTGTSACLAAVFQGVLRACTGIDVGFSTETVISSSLDDDGGGDSSDARKSVRWSNLMVPPASLLLGNLAGVVVAVSYGVDHGYQSWGPIIGKLALAGWVVAHLQGFLRGLLARRDRAPTIAVLWSVLFVSVLSLLWVNVDSFSALPARPTSQQTVL
ncbi:putative cellulose synthase A catalytic subunit 11 [UDP-forming] [Phragmites australis]|uniref:putative cellulose synthase A catalytic subunit 11 [UDP-forming] n=1 Tax=Phragmites australis TaxID=29695 RepID=UPI002D788A28|nr:putative cellulose synthase A catalytic subunit 11 [UDP-forming] [Phragmites australis]